MKVIIKIKDSETEEIINILDIKDKTSIDYVDSYNVQCNLKIFSDGIEITRNDSDHTTLVHLSKLVSYIQIKTEEGILFFDAKVIDFNINNDIIFFVYSINDEQKEINIKFIEE